MKVNELTTVPTGGYKSDTSLKWDACKRPHLFYAIIKEKLEPTGLGRRLGSAGCKNHAKLRDAKIGGGGQGVDACLRMDNVVPLYS
jgi:hypothetical protein